MSKLLFRTPMGGLSFPVAQGKLLGSIDVSLYSKIRVLAFKPLGPAAYLKVNLVFAEGGEYLAAMDTFDVTSGSTISRIYDVPGTRIVISVEKYSSPVIDSINVYVYGS